MRTKLYSLSILFLLLFVSVAWSQQYIWTTTNGLTYIDQNGSTVTHASDFAPHSVLGKSTVYYFSGGLFTGGINIEGGQENQKTGVVYPDRKGTIFGVSGFGMVQLHQFRAGIDDPANTTLFIGADEEVYYLGPYYTSTGNKQYQIGKAGGPGSRILQYAFNPNEILSSFEHYMTEPGAYGTSRTGGNYGAGFLFKVNSTHTGIEIRYHFKKETGSYPVGRLARSIDEDYLYGVTKTGGRYNYGVVFRVKPNGTNYEVIHHFNKTDGAYPDRGLASTQSGFLYGSTSKGGTHDQGVIYAVYAFEEGSGMSLQHHFNGAGAPDAAYKVEQTFLLNEDAGVLFGKNSSSIYKYHMGTYDGVKIIHSTPTKAIMLNMPDYPLVVLRYPADGATNVPVNATFRTDTLDGALNYTLQLSTSEYFQGIAQTYHSTSPSFNVQGLKPGTRYYARYKTSFWPAYGQYSSFTTHISATDGPSIVTTPADGALNAEAPTLKVTVKAVTGATRYTVQLSTSSSFTTVKSVTSTTDNQRTLTFTGLAYSTTYYARVKTNINSTYGPVTRFKTKAQVFSKVTLPTSGATGAEFAVLKVTAQTITQAKCYTLEVNTNSSFTGSKIVYTSLSDGQTSFVIRNLNPAATYYTRVKTDVNTTWGPVTSFSTRPGQPLTRIWGVTGAYVSGRGSLYSFSLDSMKFTKHLQLADEHGFGKDLVAGPDGLYGAAYNSPYESGHGHTLFRYDPSTGQLSHSVRFTNSEDIRVMMASNGQLYAAMDSWWIAGKLVRTSPDLRTFKEFYFYKDATGREPLARVVEVDGWFYGTTHVGGRTGWGTVYRVRPDGSNYTVLHDFNYNDGFFPRGLAYGNDGWIYGTTTDGPFYDSNNTDDRDVGIVFRIRLDGSVYEVLHTFKAYGPNYPEGNIMVKNGVIYGVTSPSPPGDAGTIFRMNTDGTGFVTLFSFNGANGHSPNGDLAIGRDGYLYGTTVAGGTHNRGVLFRLRADGAVFQKLFDFSDATGPRPAGNVIVTGDTFAPAATTASASMALVQVYPNPSAEVFNITRAETASGKMYVEVTDFNGNVVEKSFLENTNIEVGRALPKGIYVLKVFNGSEVTTHRLVKK
ncbi:MAG TPA: choice-of-anchor tandem repeat GloVer-containing protein [Chryseosolibacter sp.]|nr:choice-of-anchor tandem repeat GloVer-containing protein [Chryseosolibacter sp.]